MARDLSLEVEVETDRPGSYPADEAVIEALRRGEEDAFTCLVNQHHGTLRRIARLYVSSPAIADEVVQDTWLAVIQGVWAFQGRSSLKTWILRILINRAKTRALRESRTVPLGEASAEEHEMTRLTAGSRVSSGEDVHEAWLQDPESSPEASLLSREMRDRIRAAIGSLSRNQRLVITLRDVEGCSSDEVCNVMGLSETNQRVILHRARTSVRNMMTSYLTRE